MTDEILPETVLSNDKQGQTLSTVCGSALPLVTPKRERVRGIESHFCNESKPGATSMKNQAELGKGDSLTLCSHPAQKSKNNTLDSSVKTAIR